ncbi:MAG: ribonuclease E inhibitor RraB [Hyphomicrobiaceae bacterium]|nr:ribonuclease E inhibitor RraB [Hyphomicrobiaceae bacterium]
MSGETGSNGGRDRTRFPADEIGDKLYQAMLRGRSPDEEQDIDFAFLFAKKLDAEAFAARLRDGGEEPEIEHLPEEEGEIEEWEVLVTRDMDPSYGNVKAALDELTGLAHNHYGKLAYWVP